MNPGTDAGAATEAVPVKRAANRVSNAGKAAGAMTAALNPVPISPTSLRSPAPRRSPAALWDGSRGCLEAGPTNRRTPEANAAGKAAPIRVNAGTVTVEPGEAGEAMAAATVMRIAARDPKVATRVTAADSNTTMAAIGAGGGAEAGDATMTMAAKAATAVRDRKDNRAAARSEPA